MGVEAAKLNKQVSYAVYGQIGSIIAHVYKCVIAQVYKCVISLAESQTASLQSVCWPSDTHYTQNWKCKFKRDVFHLFSELC